MDKGNPDEDRYTEWPHAPSHLFVPKSAYFITASTYHKALLFKSNVAKEKLLGTIFEEAQLWAWRLEAWAVMSNHYHLVAHAPENANTLESMLRRVHSKTAVWLNKQERTPGRKVWFRYRDTCLTYQKSYMARLHYTHHNPVRHGVVANAEQYRWCSMAWFTRNAEPAFRKTVLSFKIDQLDIDDDF